MALSDRLRYFNAACDPATEPWFGTPQAACRAPHERRGVAYNAPSHSGSSK